MFEYTSSGGITVGGCSKVEPKEFKYFRFGPGYTVYSKYKAERGILEAVSIKRIDLIQNKRTLMQIVPIYKDTYNMSYNEYDLLFESEAIVECLTYYGEELSQIYSFLDDC